MKTAVNRAIILLSVFIFFQPVLAGEIVFTAESPVICDSLDEEIQISLGVTNTLGEDVRGSFTWTVRDRDDPDNTRSSTDTRVIFTDLERTAFWVQPAEGYGYLVDVAFDYLDSDDADSAYHVSLNGIRIIPADRADPGSPAEVLWSVQTRLFRGALQQQEAGPNTGVTGSGTDGQPLVKRGDENIESVSMLLENETRSLIMEKEWIWGVINRSAIYPFIDLFLKDSGYLPGNPVVSPGIGAYNDKFELVYSGINRSEIKVSGEIAGDGILFTGIESPGRMPLLYGIEENGTYLSLDGGLLDEGYLAVKSAVNITPGEALVEIAYEKGIFRKDLVISVLDGEIVSLEIREPDDGIHFVVPFMIVVLTAVCSFVFYRVYLGYLRRPGQEDPEECSYGGEDLISPGDLLDESYDKYLCGELKEAVGKAGCALRLHVSVISGCGGSLTCSEALLRLETVNDPDIESYAGVFSICDSVVYGNREPEKSEFIKIYETAKYLIDKNHESHDEGE